MKYKGILSAEPMPAHDIERLYLPSAKATHASGTSQKGQKSRKLAS